MRHTITLFAAIAILGMAGCESSTGPERFPVTLALARSSESEMIPNTVEPRIGSLVTRGTVGFSCGAVRPQARAELRGTQLTVTLSAKTMQSCPIDATLYRFDAIASGIPRGDYEVTVRSVYFSDLPPDTLVAGLAVRIP